MKKRRSILCLAFFLTVAVCFALTCIFRDKYPFLSVRPWIAAAAAVLLLVYAILVYRCRENTAAVFLISYVLLGTAFFAAIPLYRAPDETSHYLRAYEISKGYMLSDLEGGRYGGRVFENRLRPERIGIEPEKVTQYDIWERCIEEQISGKEEFLVFWNTSLYAPVSYFPQAAGMWLMGLFSRSIIWTGYAGRLAVFLAVGVLGFLAVKYVPFGKRMMSLILLVPMNMQEAVSLAPDAMVTALTCALISFVLYMCYEYTGKMKWQHFTALYVMCIMIGLYKIVYLPFCLFPFLIPKERFGGKKQYFIHAAVLGTLVAVTSMGWLMIAGRYLSDLSGADGAVQVDFILTHPLEYIKIIGATLAEYGTIYLNNIIGKDFGWLTIHISQELVILYAVICILMVLLSGEQGKRRCRALRGVSALVVASVFLLIFTSLYVQWNVPKAEIIQGVQGRYFLPLVFPLWLVIQGFLPERFSAVWQTEGLCSQTACAMVLLMGIQLCICSDILTDTIGAVGGGWRKDTQGSCYQISDGEYLKETWLFWKGNWYYLGEDGYMLTDTWIEGAAGVYYVSGDGIMLTDTVTPDGSTVDEDGRKAE